MSDEIPEDVMKAAMKLAADYFPPQRRDRSKLAWSVAVAILAEREAAARRYREGAGPNTWDYFKEAEDAINPQR